jgi:hypothetical protein
MLVAEQAENLALWASGAWCEQSGPALYREPLPDALVGVPGGSARGGRLEADLGEVLRGGEVGDLDVYLPGPQLTGHLRERRDHALGEVAILLRPGGLVGVCEIERVDDVAALPAVIRRWLALG